MTIAIIYHKSDLDGIGSAAVVLQKYHDAELYPAEYGDEDYTTEDFRGKYVIIVDFCPKEIEKIKEVSGSFVWIDHHKTAMEEHKELWTKAPGLRSLSHSAINLTWNYFNPGKEPPTVVKYIEDYDLWRFKYDEFTKAFGEYAPLVLEDPNDPEWDKLLDDNNGRNLVNKYIVNGNILLKAKERRIKRVFDNVISVNIWGYNVGFVNTPNDISNLGNHIATNGYDIGIIWRVVKDRIVRVGLRSVGNVDVSKIAKQYKGGGHKNASGFEIDLDSFIKDILMR